MKQRAATELSAAEALALLCLQVEWGAADGLDETPHDRLTVPPLAQIAAALAEPPRLLSDTTSRNAEPARAATPTAGLAGRPAGSQQAEDLAAAAGTIQALRAALEHFDGCALRKTAGHTVFAQGDPASGILLVGEVPDADEDRTGTPFAGPPGDLLDRMLGSIDLTRSGIMIAPLIPWRPPGDRKVNPVEMAACLPFLNRLIAIAQPRHLILMGTRPTRAFFGAGAALARLRGRFCFVTVPGMTIPTATLAMRHTSHLLGNALSRRDAWADLLLLRRTLDGETITTE